MTNAILRGKPDAGNPHVRFDEGEVASAKPRRGSLLYKDVLPIGGKYYFYLPNGMHYFNVDGQRRVAFVNDGATLVTEESQVRTASFAVGEHIESVHYTTVPAIANGTATGDFTLVLPKGMTVTLDVVCDKGYACFNAKTLTVGDEGLKVALTAERVSFASVDYRDANGETQTAADVTIVGPRMGRTLTNGWYVVCGTVELESLTVEGEVNLILMDGAKLTVTAVTNEAGVAVTAGNSLTIYGQQLGIGELVAKNKWVDKGYAGACIGGVLYDGCGTVTINGGIITAISEGAGAGIGGAWGGSCGNIIINGGKIAAKGSNAAGIGDGGYGRDGKVTINGGTIDASQIFSDADIGFGSHGSGTTVTINGGNIKAETIQNAPTNGANAAVWCVTTEVEKLNVEKLKVEGLDGFGTRDIVPIDGKVYLYLPNGTHIFTIDGVKYCAIVEGAATTAGIFPTCEGGEIAEGEDGVWFITPEAGVTEISVANLPAGAVAAVPPTVTQVNGVADAQIKVGSGAYDITGAFAITGGAIALNLNGSVTIGDETIPVRPIIGDLGDEDGEPFVVGDTVAVTVRTIPGLKYELWRGERIGSGGIIDPALSTGPVVATGTRVTLTDDEPPAAAGAAFYRVAVGK